MGEELHPTGSLKWYWLSFADPNLPEGTQFLGVVIIPVSDAIIELIDTLDHSDRIELLRDRGQEAHIPFYTAVQYASFLGMNPGGEVQGWEITDHIQEVKPDHRCKLLSRETLEQAGLGKEAP